MCSTSCETYEKMKITVGLGSIDDYIPFAQAGADEVFCGYVPVEWMEKAGMAVPLNRREVMYANVQIGSRSELEILADMQADYKVPVTVALNSPFYEPAYYGMAVDVIRDCASMGITSFIVADPGLLLAIARAQIEGIHLHISGEAGEANRYAVDMARECGASRIIFGRKTTIPDMRAMIEFGKEQRAGKSQRAGKPMEYEAFMLNEMCHFSGGFCCSYHCDELAPMCRVPYRLSGGASSLLTETSQWEASGAEGPQAEAEALEETLPEASYAYLPGRSGCGLCALWDLQEAGVTNLKIVSRGNYAEETLEDIRTLVRARSCMEECRKERLEEGTKERPEEGTKERPEEEMKERRTEDADAGREAFVCRMKREIFGAGCNADQSGACTGACSGNCYYFDSLGGK